MSTDAAASLPALSELLATARVVSLPLVTRFRGIDVREAVLFEGPEGWTEFSPFVEYDDAEAAAWLAGAMLVVLCLTCAVTVAGVSMWKAEATPLTGAAQEFPLAVIKGYSAVQKAGCMFGTHRCAAGTKWSCTHFLKWQEVRVPNLLMAG